MVPSGALFVHGLSVFITFYFGNDITRQVPVFRCFYNQQQDVCEFERINLDASNAKFNPLVIGGLSRNVTKIKFSNDSHMSTLTSDICDTFPALKEIHGSHLGLNHINSDAFQGCPLLEVLSLQKNNLTNIDRNLFQVNSRLKNIDLRRNPNLVVDLRDINRQVPGLEVLAIDMIQWNQIPFRTRLNMRLSRKVSIDMRNDQR